jgi:hypothetical protein
METKKLNLLRGVGRGNCFELTKEISQENSGVYLSTNIIKMRTSRKGGQLVRMGMERISYRNIEKMTSSKATL